MTSEPKKESKAKNFTIALFFWLNSTAILFNAFQLAVIFGYSTSTYAKNAHVEMIAAQIAANVLVSIIYLPMMKRHKVNWKFWGT